MYYKQNLFECIEYFSAGCSDFVSSFLFLSSPVDIFPRMLNCHLLADSCMEAGMDSTCPLSIDTMVLLS